MCTILTSYIPEIKKMSVKMQAQHKLRIVHLVEHMHSNTKIGFFLKSLDSNFNLHPQAKTVSHNRFHFPHV